MHVDTDLICVLVGRGLPDPAQSPGDRENRLQVEARRRRGAYGARRGPDRSEMSWTGSGQHSQHTSIAWRYCVESVFGRSQENDAVRDALRPPR